MTEIDDFLAEVLPKLQAADRALHDGDAAPRSALWSHAEPVTVFGAWMSSSGWPDTSRLFSDLARGFTDCESFEIELIAAGASGDLAYTAAYEHSSATVNGVPRTYTLRVTQVYRRVGGEWRVVHRQGDEVATDQPRVPPAL